MSCECCAGLREIYGRPVPCRRCAPGRWLLGGTGRPRKRVSVRLGAVGRRTTTAKATGLQRRGA